MSSVKRLIARRGQTWRIQYWVEGAINQYQRSNKTLGSVVEFKGIRTETAKETSTIEARGEERTLDAQLIVNDSVDVEDIEDTSKIAPVVTSPSGVRYDAMALGREGEIMGFHRIFLSKRRGTGTPLVIAGGFNDGFSNGFDI